MTDHSTDLCPDGRLEAARALVVQDGLAGTTEVAALLGLFPRDPRLHFLHGSLAAGLGDYEAARRHIGEAVTLAPDFAIARFQLGLLHLTSGDAAQAEPMLTPLLSLGDGSALRHFASGLLLLARDRFDEAITSIERGLACGTDNVPLEHDMRMLIETIVSRDTGTAVDDQPLSAAHLLLQQAALRPTRH
jgi:tetratricopeptide (TPR) repeat protein